MDNAQLHSYIEEHYNNIAGIVASKNGKRFYSDNWHGFNEDNAVHVMSVTKSVVSLLIGIAVDRGLIEGLGQPVLDYFPDYKIKRGEKTIQSVTIEHLMTMTAPYKYRSEPWSKICSSDDWTTATLDVLGGKAGLTGTFRYSTLGIHILTAIITAASGMKTVDFANEFLFEPIGAAAHTNYFAQTAEEHKEFTISKAPKQNVWFCAPDDVGAAGYGLCLTASDMEKLGRLCLEGGMYGGKRVVSSEWIAESTRPRRQCGEDFANMGYGLLWWTPDMSRSAYAALGNSGNVIYVNPDNGVVVAVASTFKPMVLDRVDFIREHIEPLADNIQRSLL